MDNGHMATTPQQEQHEMNDLTNITVIENPLSDFEHIELDSEGQAIKYRPTPEEYKKAQPDYNPGPVLTVSKEARENLRWNTDLERLEHADGSPVLGSLFKERA